VTILAVDSSAVTAGCAVCRNGEVLAHKLEKSGLTHSQTLLPLIDSVLKEAGVSVTDIDILAVSSGPGSFTGVRIGISTVKGISFTYNIPCVGVSTLDAIAYGAIELNGYIVAVMDARREQVYNAIYKISDGMIEKLTEDRAIAISQLADEIEQLDGEVWFCGDGALLCYNILKDKLSGVKIVPDNILYQSGMGVARAALASGKDAVVSGESLLPTYLRLPQAERELNNRNKSLQGS